MKAWTAAIGFAGLLGSQMASAVIFTEEPDPAYEALSQSAYCMNHFLYRTSSHISYQAAHEAQTALVTQLNSLHDTVKVAEAIRLAFYAASLPRKDDSVPPHCWQFIPKDHNMDETQMQYFLKHGAIKP
jgi:hypothetical protein